MKKKFLAVLLIFCMVFNMLPLSAFADTVSVKQPFSDVNATDWYHDAVQYVYEKGLINGVGDDIFSPQETTTRGMIVTILHRMENKPSFSGGFFADVSAGQWYSDAIAWAAVNGVVNGYENGNFGPNDVVTREQLTVILYRYAQFKGMDLAVQSSLDEFSDSSAVSGWAAEAMRWAVGAGIINGDNGNLRPVGKANRAEVAMMLMRYCENIVSESKVDNPSTQDPTVDKTYTVKFDLNYGNNTQYDTKTVKAGATVDKPTDPERSEYTFAGWYTAKSGGSQFDFKKGITSDLTLYAHWNSNGRRGGHSSNSGSSAKPVDYYYTVTFDANGGVVSNSSLRIASGSAIATLPTAT